MKSRVKNRMDKKMEKGVIYRIGKLAGISLLGLTLVACGQTKNADQGKNTPVESTTVEAYGVVEAEKLLDVVIDFPAKVKQIFVEEGQKIGKETKIATLDIDQYLLQIQTKEIELKISGNEKTKILSENTVDLSNDQDYKKLQDAYGLAKKNYDQAMKDFKNAGALLPLGAISQTEYDLLKLTSETKLNALTNIESDIALYKKSKAGVTSSVGIKNLQAESTNLTLANMKEKLRTALVKNDTIFSPFENAVIYNIGYEEGASIDTAVKFCTLADLSSLVINADITEDFISEVKIGAAVVIVPVADRSKAYHGKVTRIADMAKIENGETLIGVEIEIEDNDGFLKPNYNVDISISK